MVFGTGLIGGSVGMALRERGWRVTGTDVAPGVAARAVELGALDAEGEDRGADLVVVATPVQVTAAVVSEVLASPSWNPEAVVTDVGSVKGPLVAAVDGPRFVGGHPMAGSEQVGVEGASADLFVGATWVLTPTAATDPNAYARLRAVLADLGADVVALDPAEHDSLVAVVSHVPHLTAATLMALAADLGEEHGPLLQLAAGGFRDMTRIAAGQPSIWSDICDDNADAIVATFDLLIDALGAMRQRVADHDHGSLIEVLDRAATRAAGAQPACTPSRGACPGAGSRARPGGRDRGRDHPRLRTRDQHLRRGDRPLGRGRPRRAGTGHRRGLGPRLRRRTRRAGISVRDHPDRDGAVTDAAVVPHAIPGGRVLVGTLAAPGDKSISHRALLLAALADGTSTIAGLSDGDDVRRTAGAVGHLGAAVNRSDGVVTVSGGRSRLRAPEGTIDLGNSGTGMRLLAGVVATVRGVTRLTGDASLRSRPMDRVAEPLGRMGATVVGEGPRCLPPVSVSGGDLSGIDYTTPMASAQVKGAVLLAGLDAAGETVVRERVATRAHTEEMLAEAGADITVERSGAGRVVRVRRSALRPGRISVPGDPSQAAFWVVAGLVVPGSRVTVTGVHLGEERTGYLGVLRRMGGAVTVVEEDAPGTGSVTSISGPLQGTTVEAAEIPSLDEVPILAVAAAVAEGPTRFRGVGELRVKESDRLEGTAELVRAFGGAAEVEEDDLVVAGGARLVPGRLDARGDHRMAMAAAVAGAACADPGPTLVTGWESVATSYPGFAAALEGLAREGAHP